MKKYLIYLFIGLLFAFLIMIIYGLFKVSNTELLIRILADGFTISGAIFSCLGLLLLVSNGGAMDAPAYLLKFVGDLFIPRTKDKLTYTEFKLKRSEKKRDFKPMLFVGLLFIIISIVFIIINNLF